METETTASAAKDYEKEDAALAAGEADLLVEVVELRHELPRLRQKVEEYTSHPDPFWSDYFLGAFGRRTARLARRESKLTEVRKRRGALRSAHPDLPPLVEPDMRLLRRAAIKRRFDEAVRVLGRAERMVGRTVGADHATWVKRVELATADVEQWAHRMATGGDGLAVTGSDA